MAPNMILMLYRPRHFILKELLCQHIHGRFGEFAWRFFDERLLMTIDFVRDHLGPIYVNNWDMTDEERAGMPLFTQRGFRCTECELVRESIKKRIPYASAHGRAQAIDFNVKDMTPGKVRLWITGNSILLPFPIRVEKGTSTWVHIDVCNGGTGKVELINP